MGRVLATIATLLILVLGAAFAAPAIIDWESFRASFEEAASTALGRKIETKGPIDIALLPEPRIRLGQVAIKGYGGGGEALVTAAKAEAILSLQALLTGQIEVKNVRLVRPVFRIDLTKKESGALDAFAGESRYRFVHQIHDLEIEDGRLTVFSKGGGQPASFDRIRGTLKSPAPGAPFRFNGHFVRNGKAFEAKFLASTLSGEAVRLSGSIVDPASKSSLQADGTLSVADGPVFQGTLIANRMASGSDDPAIFGMAIQAKAAAKADLGGVVLNDLSITIDPDGRPQIFTGWGSIAFEQGKASFTLKARSLDADMLLASGAHSFDNENRGGWSPVLSAVNELLWAAPDLALRVSLAADQLVLRGEPIEGVKVDAERAGNRWLFEKVLGLFPGDTAVRLVGSVSQSKEIPQLSGVVSADGKNSARFARWLSPSAPEVGALPASPFTVSGSVTLSDAVAAFEGVKGEIGGTPFNASFHLDKGTAPKLFLTLSGDSFDLSRLDAVHADVNGGALNAFPAWQASLSRAFPSLAASIQGLAAADIDISARSIRTNEFEARNFAARASFGPDELTFSKLSLETPEGLLVSGEGIIPLKNAKQGRFEGKIDAKSAQALGQAAKFIGHEQLGGRRIEDLVPASIRFSTATGAGAGGFSAKAEGSLGGTHFEGRGQLKGSLADWKDAPLSVQFEAASDDGNKLLAQLFAGARSAPAAGQSPGKLAARFDGKPDKLETSVSVNAPLLQLHLDGISSVKDGNYQFAGRGSAASITPDLFLPRPVLALLAGKDPANMRLEAELKVKPGAIEAHKLRADSGGNSVTGNLYLDWSGSAPRIEADLKTEELSLASLLDYFLVSTRDKSQPFRSLANALSADGSEAWPNRPFDLAVFRNSAARLFLEAKKLKIGDSLPITDSEVTVSLKDGRLEIERLLGKALGGEIDASLSLSASETAVKAASQISLSDINLSDLPQTGHAALLAGKASLTLSATGQGLSPLGVVAVMKGNGRIAISDGQIFDLSPAAIEKAAEEMMASPKPLAEDEIVRNALKAVKSADFKFHRLTVPVTIQDGVLEIKGATFQNRDGAIRLEAYLDLTKLKVDSTWHVSASSGRKEVLPPIRLTAAGPLRELGGHPETISAEDFARSIIVRKMEGDINRLESLNRPPSPWTTTQESQRKAQPTRKAKKAVPPQKTAESDPPEATKPPAEALPSPLPTSDFAKKMQNVLQDAARRPGQAP